MDGYQKIGQLTPSTLVYTIGAMIISLPSIADCIPAIHKDLIADFPQYSRMEIDVVRSNPITAKITPDTIVQHSLCSGDRSWGIIITPERILLQTTKYENFLDFSQRFGAVLRAIQKNTGLQHHNGIAFRHIDNIKPLDVSQPLSEVVESAFLTPTIGTTTDSHNSRHEYVYSAGARNLAFRLYTFENGHGPRVPEEIISNYIALKMKAPDEMESSPYVLADFEAVSLSNEISLPYDVDTILSELDELHQFVSIAYRKVVKPNELKARGAQDVS